MASGGVAMCSRRLLPLTVTTKSGSRNSPRPEEPVPVLTRPFGALPRMRGRVILTDREVHIRALPDSPRGARPDKEPGDVVLRRAAYLDPHAWQPRDVPSRRRIADPRECLSGVARRGNSEVSHVRAGSRRGERRGHRTCPPARAAGSAPWESTESPSPAARLRYWPPVLRKP